MRPGYGFGVDSANGDASMSGGTDEHIGARIADYRKLRQLTQIGLAQRAFVSRGTIAKVEAGLSPATPAMVAAVARALEVDVAVLNGQPYLSEMQQDKLDHMIAPLSAALCHPGVHSFAYRDPEAEAIIGSPEHDQLFSPHTGENEPVALLAWVPAPHSWQRSRLAATRSRRTAGSPAPKGTASPAPAVTPSAAGSHPAPGPPPRGPWPVGRRRPWSGAGR